MLNHSGGSEATVGDGVIMTKNKKNDPPSIKILDLRVKILFHLRAGIHDFRRNCLPAFLKSPPKYILGPLI